eukprot:contig_27545_g6775
MEDEFSRAGIYAALIGHPSIRGYNLPAGLGTSGAYSIYPRPYLVRSDTELVGAFPENSNAHREATAICTTRACLGVIINGLMELEKSICRGTVKPDDLGDHVATWRTAVYQLLASKSASYDILLYLRRYKTFGHNLYRDLFLNRGAGRDSPAVPRYNVRVAADRAGFGARDHVRTEVSYRNDAQAAALETALCRAGSPGVAATAAAVAVA